MKLKYYLRGLGTGIAVTALILGISSGVSDKNIMTDEEVLARAKQLGLVERTVLSDMVKNTETSETEKAKAEETKAEENEETKPEENEETKVVTEEEIVDTEQEETSMMTDETEDDIQDVNDSVNEAEEFGMPDEAGTVTITIERGDSSDSVSRMLEEAGLVDNATAYDKYLCQNGYDKSIRIGNFEIPADATGEEIAKLITGR